MTNPPRVEGVDYTAEGVATIRNELIAARKEGFRGWPDTIPFTVLTSHVIALLADYIKLLKTKEKAG